MNKINDNKWVRFGLYNYLRINAWIIPSLFIVAFISGVFSDAISHGIILSSRNGHKELAEIGIIIFCIGIIGLWFCNALYRRLLVNASRIVEMVENDK